MNKLCKLLNLENDDELFEKITQSFKEKGITLWDYFVDWNKVHKNIVKVEKELNLLNVLVGKENLKEELIQLIIEYPKVIEAIPYLLAIRFKKKAERNIYILLDPKLFTYELYPISQDELTNEKAEKIADFFINCGLGELIKEKKIKNLVDYATGVEAGIDSNGRKNRGGKQMEKIVGVYVNETCNTLGLEYLKEANAAAILKKWNIHIQVKKSSKRIDYVINKNGSLFFIECNFYGGGGSKLKSTATEYIEMNRYWNNQGIEFIWITDGAGWSTALKPLRDYFDKADYLLNLEMLKNDVLKSIFNYE
jgi:type II restriction enzyme